MFTDTDAIRAFGAANSAQAADLATVAAALSAMPGATADATFGPVGAGFLAALAEATTETSRAAIALADRLTAGCATAQASASAYDTADQGAAAAVARR